MLNRTDRRNFLRGVGASLALPMLESFAPRSARGCASDPDGPPSLHRHLPGLLPVRVLPAADRSGLRDFAGAQAPLSGFRDQATIFSGLDHRGRNGHAGWRAWMSGSAAGSVSLDQVVARPQDW